MGERKVINKYYPVDFDPSKLPRTRRPTNNQIKVRTMISMTIRCNLCGNFIYKGTKVNARKEDAVGDKYLGCVQIYRFYFKCTKCSAEIAIKTDPQNSDYFVESGATRFYSDSSDHIEPLDNDKYSLEKRERNMDLDRTIENLAFLQDLKSMHTTVPLDAMLEALKKKKKKQSEQEEEDEALIKTINFQSSRDHIRRRITDDQDEDLPSGNRQKLSDQNHPPTTTTTTTTVSNLVRFVRRKPEKVDKSNGSSTILDSLRQNYGEDDD